ncbi:DUF1788 domain-containing protein [Proteiniclasticum ruminis]
MMASLEERLDKVERLIRAESFRKNKGLGNEVGYYIFDYPAEKELQVRERVSYMVSKNSRGIDGFQLIVFDLYDILIDILEREGFTDQVVQFEKEYGLGFITDALQMLLKLGERDNLVVKYFQENTPDDAVVFIIGIGKCYPIIRSHSILNNLHQVIDRVPVVMFFPGLYDGQELSLFSKIGNNYYRAFKLVE